MTDTRNLLGSILSAIDKMSDQDLLKYPELARTVPLLIDALQIEDVCDHKYENGQCICGSVLTQDVD